MDWMPPMPPMQFAPPAPMQARPNPMQQGMAMLQAGNRQAAGAKPAAPAVDGGMMAQLMGPGGLIGALLNRNKPVNPGAPLAASSANYVPGGVGPLDGGPAPVPAQVPDMGMLAGLLQGNAGGW